MDKITIELIEKIVAFIERASPELWEIAQRQVMANIIGHIFCTIIFATISILLIIFIRRWKAEIKSLENEKYPDWTDNVSTLYHKYQIFDTKRKSKINDLETAVATCTVLYIITIAATLSFMHGLIMRLINPAYYAIEILIEFVK